MCLCACASSLTASGSSGEALCSHACWQVSVSVSLSLSLSLSPPLSFTLFSSLSFSRSLFLPPFHSLSLTLTHSPAGHGCLGCTRATLCTESPDTCYEPCVKQTFLCRLCIDVCTAMHSLSGSGQGRKSESVDGVRQRRGHETEGQGKDLSGKNELHHVSHVELLSKFVLELVFLCERRHSVFHRIWTQVERERARARSRERERRERD